MFTSPRKGVLIIIFAIISIVGIIVAFAIAPKKAGPEHSVPVDEAGEIVVRGEMVCLPHHTTDGPQTLECAFGLKGTNGHYYALRDSDPAYQNISNVPMGVGVEVVGTFTPQEDSKYQSVGVIEVTSITVN